MKALAAGRSGRVHSFRRQSKSEKVVAKVRLTFARNALKMAVGNFAAPRDVSNTVNERG